MRAKDYYDRMVKSQSPVTLRSLFHPDKLLYIASWGFDQPTEVSLLTDQVLSRWVAQQLNEDGGESVNHIQAAMASLRMEFTPGIPQSGVEKFIQSFENTLHKYHLGYMRNSDEGRERLVRILIRAVRPRELQEMLRAEIENDPVVGKNLARFHQRLKACAVMVDRVLICQRRLSSYSKQGKTEAGKQQQSKEKAGAGKKRPREDQIDTDKGKAVICWLCKKEGHPRRLCPDKKLNKKTKTRSGYVGVCALNLDSERSILVQIGEESRIPAILDSGAHHVSLIPRSRINRLVNLGMEQAVLERLRSPVEIKLGDNQSTVKVWETVTLDIIILTRTGQFPVKDCRFLVWDVPGDELILGSDVLESLGIDPYRALDALAESATSVVGTTKALNGIELDAVRNSIDRAVVRAQEAGLHSTWPYRLKNLLNKYIDTFRVKMCEDSPASVTPFVTRLKPEARPYKCKPRRYSQEQSQFLKNFTDELVEKGLVYENLNSEWASPVLVVRKAGGGHRMCVDLRAVNAMSESTVWPMPFLESIVTHLQDSKFWFKLDAFKGFWLMPLAEECQEMFSFMTDRAIYTPRRSIQGALNSAIQFQSRMHEVFKELIFDKVIIWIDDLLGHASSLELWFAILTWVLDLATHFNIKFNIEKCEFFTAKVKYCGRIFSTEGVSHDPDRVDALVNLSQPKTARDLQQFLMAAQWMSRSIPEYNTKVYSLQLLYERAMKDQPARTKTVARQVKLANFGWNAHHALAFEQLKQAIANHVRLVYPQKDMVQCLYTDANEYNSSAVVTQIPVDDLGKPVSQQRHEPLGFCGHKFAGSQLNWSIVEKEGFAVVDALSKLDYLLMNDRPFRLFVDHKNLTQIFSPSTVSKPVAQKLQRWALQIQKFNYEICYITGEENVWSDLMTRWGAAPMQVAKVMALRVSSVTVTDIPVEYRVRPLQNPDFVWPSVEEIRRAQQQSLQPSTCVNSDNLIVTKKGRVIIPLEAGDLRIRLCIIAHSGGNNGHIGYQAALDKLNEYFFWPNMTADMREFCQSCLHCLPTRGGVRIPRPLGEAVHGQYPNHVIHLDWIYIMPAETNSLHKYQWNLIIRDDLSGYVRITPAAIPDCLLTVDALMDWRASSRTPKIMVTDMASYFVSSVMKEFTKRCNLEHHVTVAYGHYSNGSIEVINKHYLALIRALISELHWKKTDWPWLNKNIEHTLNHRSQARLGGKAPVTVFTGQKPDNPFEQLFVKPSDHPLAFYKVSMDKIAQGVERRGLNRNVSSSLWEEDTLRFNPLLWGDITIYPTPLLRFTHYDLPYYRFTHYDLPHYDLPHYDLKRDLFY